MTNLNIPLDITTAKSCNSKSWKHQTTTWVRLTERLSQTHRTHETFKEYRQGVGNTARERKDWRDRIKDVGGFVGGMLSGPRRLAGNVVHRQIITLDCDKAQADLWQSFAMLYDCAACLYSTHSHSPEAPKYRLVVPLNRPCDPVEYEAAARKLAEHIGIEQIDHTCFRPHQLMYWPSTAKDGVFVFEKQDGNFLSVDGLLSSYANWRDSTEWPLTDSEKEAVKHGVTKQGDPLEKPGIVGAFCRTYSVTDAIAEFLPDVYEPCAIDDRYTFTHGTTSAGLVIYEDKFAYSHHSTDPVCGKLCNAFDLVRLHLYGIKDEDAKDGTPPQKLPSFIAMADRAASDPRVRERLTEERLAEARDDFANIAQPETNGGADPGAAKAILLNEQISYDRRGRPISSGANYMRYLNIEGWRFRFNELTERPEVIVPELPEAYKSGELTEDIYKKTYTLIHGFFGSCNESLLRNTLGVEARRDRYHPVRDYLNGLQWDGEKRLESLLIGYLGAEDTEYTRAVTRKWFTAAVARVFEPGVKFDNMLVLIGPQGLGKSTLLARIGGDFYSDSLTLHHLQDNKAAELLASVWVMEIAELAGLHKVDIERLKSFISTVADRYRPAYARDVLTRMRQCVLVATTNKFEPLRDTTGNRRFWVVACNTRARTGRAWDLDNETVAQIWAEAAERYKAGETLYLDPVMEQIARSKQSMHTVTDDRLPGLIDWLNEPVPSTWKKMTSAERIAFFEPGSFSGEPEETGLVRDRISVQEIAVEYFRESKTRLDKRLTSDIRDMLTTAGWVPNSNKQRVSDYGVVSVLDRPEKGAKTGKKDCCSKKGRRNHSNTGNVAGNAEQHESNKDGQH